VVALLPERASSFEDKAKKDILSKQKLVCFGMEVKKSLAQGLKLQGTHDREQDGAHDYMIKFETIVANCPKSSWMMIQFESLKSNEFMSFLNANKKT
jgi:hypothetical protein